MFHKDIGRSLLSGIVMKVIFVVCAAWMLGFYAMETSLIVNVLKALGLKNSMAKLSHYMACSALTSLFDAQRKRLNFIFKNEIETCIVFCLETQWLGCHYDGHKTIQSLFFTIFMCHSMNFYKSIKFKSELWTKAKTPLYSSY